MLASQIRRRFLDYFSERGHREVPSSSLVPADDPTLLFTNAGMVQFKRTFLGTEARDYKRATTSQKCVRAGGKHNDLEQVGVTRRHHTFFEMLGNFSFGDYFKREAIAFAWEFVTSPTYLGLPPERLRVSVHHTDDEARALWREISGLPDHRIYGLGDKDNFWQMGDTGPCGPCTEIFVDLEWTPATSAASLAEVISTPDFERLGEEGRFLEIWNLVFMQFDRSADGTLTPLPRPSVDTGAGLERIAAVLQGEDDNFHTDLFAPLLARVGELVGVPYPREVQAEDTPGQLTRLAFRVLADHARAVSFLLADGVVPSNDGRGYVLRRILRRAVRYAYLVGRREPTLTPLVEVVIAQMGDVYPELVARQAEIRRATQVEEEQFFRTIEGGMARLDEIFAAGGGQVVGDDAFKLYDTFGFPIDLTQLIAYEKGWTVDLDGFEEALQAQKKRSRDARGGKPAVGDPKLSRDDGEGWTRVADGASTFVGYGATSASTDVLAYRADGDRLEIRLRDNPFYAESGGQVADTGVVSGDGWSLAVESIRKTPEGSVLVGPVSGSFVPGTVTAVVDDHRRHAIERNHSATHLAHNVLRKRLGEHVRQQGSRVDPERLRFDFSHSGPIDPVQLKEIEQEVNELIWANHPVDIREMPKDDALKLGAMAFFQDKYGDVVRVVKMGPSVELCGGTHVRTTGQIGLFRIAAQSGVAAGTRRLEALTGARAYAEVGELEHRLQQVAERLKAQPDQLLKRLDQLIDEKAALEHRVQELLKGGANTGPTLDTQSINGVSLAVGDTPLEDRDEVGGFADRFRAGKSSSLLVLFGTTGKGAIHVAVTDDLVRAGKKAGDLVNRLAALSGGKGGGRPHFASAGAGDITKLGAARAETPRIVAEWLSA